jgi:hypothetical protein
MKIKTRYDAPMERRSVYPDVPSQIDAIYKGFKAIRDAGITLPPDTLAWIAELDEIKSRYPKR